MAGAGRERRREPVRGALRASTTLLVGRGEEIDLLLRRWERAKGGEGSVVLLAGEPGIGKSRIAETVLERLSGEPHTRLCVFCWRCPGGRPKIRVRRLGPRAFGTTQKFRGILAIKVWDEVIEDPRLLMPAIMADATAQAR